MLIKDRNIIIKLENIIIYWYFLQIYDNLSSFLIQIGFIVVAVAFFTVRIFLKVPFKPSQPGHVGKILCLCGSLLVIQNLQEISDDFSFGQASVPK